MSKIRVLIVEDSQVVGEHLRRIITADPRLEVAAIATTGEDAIALVERMKPDVISMDIQLPGIQGFETTQRIMAEFPTPIVVVSGIGMAEITLTMRALRAGALAVVEKPAATTNADYAALASRLCTQLAIMSQVHVLRQRPVAPRVPSRTLAAPVTKTSYRLLGIAASTGGPGALMQVLCGLGSDFPLPVAVVQHMTPTFLKGFADWLESVTPFPVSIIERPTGMSPGRVYLAPPKDFHMIVNDLTVLCDDRPPTGGHRPSANSLFSSMALSLGANSIGVLLTGMGDDGAAGMRELKRAGAYTIAEDESTAVVYGMPGAAVQMGAVRETLPLGEIGPRVLKLITEKRMPA